MPQKHQNNRLPNPCSPTLRIFIIRMGHTQVLINTIEMVHRRAARFCHDYTSTETGCLSEIINKLHLELLTTWRTNIRLTIFHKAIHSHLSLPVANLLQPIKRHSRHLNSKAYNQNTREQELLHIFLFSPNNTRLEFITRRNSQHHRTIAI